MVFAKLVDLLLIEYLIIVLNRPIVWFHGTTCVTLKSDETDL